MRKRNLKLTLEYDGSRFFGFQRQKEKPTIQAALEEALSRLLNRRMKISAAAGRTDAGVHAEAQVVNFKTDSRLLLEKVQNGLNALLPKEIAVKKIEAVPDHFHARYNARWKTYEYRVFNSRIRSPLLNGRVHQYPYPLDLAKMRHAAKRLVGRHDFKAFQAVGSNVRNSVRQIRRFKIERQGNLFRFTIEANGFLYHMVRNLVGTLLEVGRGKRDGLSAGPTVPPHGLTLVSVKYPRKVAKSQGF